MSLDKVTGLRPRTAEEACRLIGRSQPEVSRLLHFHGTSPLARVLRAHSADVHRIIASVEGRQVRVFGSVATTYRGLNSARGRCWSRSQPPGSSRSSRRLTTFNGLTSVMHGAWS